MVTIIGLFLAACCTGQDPTTPGAHPADLLTGPKFQIELDHITSGSWANVELRPLLNKLGVLRRVSIVLDRRIDPTVQLPVNLVNRTLKDGIREIAGKVGADVCVPENVLFIGPPSSTQRLRTLIELRSAEITSKSIVTRDTRRNELQRRQTFVWADLDSPAEILQRMASAYRLRIQNPDLIPHDLWAGNCLPSVSIAEGLSLVLIQFDLTFRWVDGGNTIELAQIPSQVVLERRTRIKGRSASDVLKSVTERFPDLQAKIDNGELLVNGSVEDHEAIAALLNPSAVRKPAAQEPVPLRQRNYTLTFERVPVRDVMKRLEESNVVFIYDEAALKAAGINLDEQVSLQLTKATSDEFFRALFTPLKLSFEIDNVTVKLTPKK